VKPNKDKSRPSTSSFPELVQKLQILKLTEANASVDDDDKDDEGSETESEDENDDEK